MPAIADPVPTGPGGLSQQRRESHDPAVDSDVVDLDAALGEQLLNVAVGQRETQVPAERQDDDVRREAEASEGGSWDCRRATAASSHRDSLIEFANSSCNSAVVDYHG